MKHSDKIQRQWQRNLGVISLLLAIWFVVSYVAAFYAPTQDALTFLGIPLGPHMAAQMALILYVGVVARYAWLMSGGEPESGVREE